MKKKYDIKGMTCAACQAHVENATKKVNGVISCNVNLLNNNMVVEVDDKYVDGDIEKSVSDAGYSASIHGEKKIESKNDNDHSLRNLIVSAIILLILMYVSMGNMMWNFPLPPIFDMKENKMGFALIQFILVLPIVYIYRGYFIRGFKRLIKLEPNMDTLIAIGASASLIYGIFSLFMISYGYYIGGIKGYEYIDLYHKDLYFESAGMILVLVSLGKYLEGLSKRKTTKAIEELVKMAPSKARIIKDNEEIIIDAKDVKIGDIVICKAGDIIPVDGKVIDGNGSVNESNITGEPIPNFKKEGDELYSSTILESGYLKIEALKVGNDTSFSKIIELVEEASNSKAPISRIADKVSKIFVPIILAIAILTFNINLLVAINLDLDLNAFSLALNFAITVVVIACPCALGLATPVAIMVGTGKGASLGLIIKNGEILENTSKIKTIVFDKTGTITIGKPIVTDFINIKNLDLYSILYNIEIKSSHPLAKAIIEYTKDKAKRMDYGDVTLIEGEGLKTNFDNHEYYIGNSKSYDLDTEYKNKIIDLEKEGKTVLIITDKDNLLGIIALKDMPKENSREAISNLNKMGIKTIMLTGDNKNSGLKIANDVGIDEVIADVLPIDKGRIINEIKERGNGLVSMVGDGVNDALALANADIAISIGNGSDVAINSSDIVLLHNDLLDIPNVIRLSKRVLNTIKLCLFWAFFYNFICVIFATGFLYYINGFKITPMYGSIAMSISSVSVVLTALSINLFKVKKNNNIEIKEEEIKMENIVINVEGMMCMHCAKHVEEACLKVNGVKDAKVSLENKNVTLTGDNIDINKVKENINLAGYKAL